MIFVFLSLYLWLLVTLERAIASISRGAKALHVVVLSRSVATASMLHERTRALDPSLSGSKRRQPRTSSDGPISGSTAITAKRTSRRPMVAQSSEESSAISSRDAPLGQREPISTSSQAPIPEYQSPLPLAEGIETGCPQCDSRYVGPLCAMHEEWVGRSMAN